MGSFSTKSSPTPATLALWQEKHELTDTNAQRLLCVSRETYVAAKNGTKPILRKRWVIALLLTGECDRHEAIHACLGRHYWALERKQRELRGKAISGAGVRKIPAAEMYQYIDGTMNVHYTKRPSKTKIIKQLREGFDVSRATAYRVYAEWLQLRSGEAGKRRTLNYTEPK